MSAASRPFLAASLVLALLGAPRWASAQNPEQRPSPRPESLTPAARATADRFEVTARSETYLHVFRRALLPGPAGALVVTETAAPFTQYLAARATDVDSPWHRDALDFEVAAWGQVWPTTAGYERPFDGDVQSANVRYRVGRSWLRLGRQLATGGAARFARFDGLMASGALESGVSLSAYGGAAVLPRWDALPGYHQLGAAERDLLRGVPLSLDRSQQWLVGARVGYEGERLRGALSFHEQREGGGLGRRNLGLDLGGQPFPALGYGASALLELGGRRLADLRAWIDLEPHRLLRLSLEALRTEPSLFLSRQSVLSVFSAEGYRELGGYVSAQPLPWLRLEGSGFGQVYDLGRPGARAELAAKIDVDRYYVTSLRVAYSRVLIGDAGYEALRASLLRQLTRALRATAEVYGFFYDQPVQGYRASAVYSTTLDLRASDRLSLLWGASLSRSPYSRLDAQTLVRVSYDLDARARERAW